MIPRAKTCNFDALGITACCLLVPRLLLHGTCQFSCVPRFAVSIYVFNDLRKRSAELDWLAASFRNAKRTHGVEILYGMGLDPGEGAYRRENPLREERSGGSPLIAPTCRMNRCLPLLDLVASRCHRMSRETGTPVRREASRSHSKSSSVTRIVNLRVMSPTVSQIVYRLRTECHHFQMSEIGAAARSLAVRGSSPKLSSIVRRTL